MASSSQTIASSGISYGCSYDVFINFRGVDTRENFVCLLHDGLRRDGFHAFIDSEDLWEGEEIRPSLLKAIQGSKISIPVFSKHYADSKYCLLELAEIWDCCLTQDQTILPIFIDVEPREVENQSGSFEGPFQKYKSKCKPTVEDWENALTKVGKIKGWHLKREATIKDQLNIVEKVVQRVSGELDNTPLYEGKHLVGINSHVDELLRLLHIGSDDIRFVGICGMGGLGKTTIAEVVYHRIFKSFKRRSFITDVGKEASQGDKGLVSLQKRFLKNIFDKKYKISTVRQGENMIAKKLNRENILLILDDVNDHRQLDALVGGFHWFGQGSKVIITTRDEHTLNAHAQKIGKDIQMYKPEEMNFENSLKLFSWHAFSMNEPPEKYKELSHEVVQYADGLPLTLEVLGSFLVDKIKEEWEDTLNRLKGIDGKSIKDYDDKVFEKLLISYNQLGDSEKTIFLDVACNFNGWQKETAIEVWEACNLDPRLAIKELILKHLLKIDDAGNLKMHDQLRYMGVSIIKKESNGDPTKFVRLWSEDKMWEALKEDTGTQMVEGIILYRDFGFESKQVLSCDAFRKMPNLRFLKINRYTGLNGDFSHLSSKLKWVTWRFSRNTLPKFFYHTELVHLNLSDNEFNQLWNDPPQNENKRFKRLKVLNLHHSSINSISPNFFSWFPCLQSLNLSSSVYLSELPESFCKMVSLKSVNLNGCINLGKLPTSIGHLKQLVKLYLCNTLIEEVPDGVGQLEELAELDVSHCHQLVKLPTSMARMRSFLDFNLNETNEVKFPDDFSKLSSLLGLKMGKKYHDYSHLDVPCSYNSYDLAEFEYYSSLTESDFYSSSFPVLPSTLTHLEVKSFTSQPDVSNLKELEELSIESCKSWVELLDLSNMRRLRKLTISECENLKKIPNLEGTESLEELDVYSCNKLTELRGLSKLKRLRMLKINQCENLEKIYDMEGIESLEDLDMYSCNKLTELQGLSKLKRLRMLKINQCENLDPEEINSLEGKESLEELYAEGCFNLTKTMRKIHGKGTFVDNVGEVHLRPPKKNVYEVEGSNSIADGEIYNASPILCVAFTFNPMLVKINMFTQKWPVSLEIEALIRRGEMKTRFVHSIRIEEIESTYQDIIYIHHMKGCDWFGFPLETKNAIEKLTVIVSSTSRLLVYYKFCTILFEKKESDQQIPNQESSATLVADFFRWSDAEEDEEGAKEAYFLRSSVGWSDANDDEEVDEEDADDDEEVDKEDADDDEEIEDGHEEVDEEEEHALSASNYMETFLDGEDNQYEEEFLEEGKNRAVCCLSCFGF